MNQRTLARVKLYLDNKIPLSRFYSWYMNHKWTPVLDENNVMIGVEDTNYEDTRVTLVLYEFTSAPIKYDKHKEKWLKQELKDIMNETGRWKPPVTTPTKDTDNAVCDHE